MKRSLLVIFLVLLVSSICYSAEKISFFISYNMIFQGQKSVMRIYSQAGEKVRFETESTIKSVVDGVKSEKINISSTIYRIDKGISYVLNDYDKVAYEQKLSEKELLLVKSFTGECTVNQYKKIGESIVLGHACEGYLYEGKYKVIDWVSKEHNLILRMENGEGDLKTITEATELKFDRPSDNLFEVPSNYRIVQTVITSEEDLKREPPVTLDVIQGLLFENLISINIHMPETKFRELSKKEIDIFRIAIKNGTGLQETNNSEIYKVSSNQANVGFDLTWAGNVGCNIWYDNASGFMYVDKVNIHRKDQEKHKFDTRWIKKYLMGAYKFKPSKEIMKILK